MNPTLLTATAGRVLRQLRADPRSMALLLVVPVLLLTLFYFIYQDNPQLFNVVGVVMTVVLPMSLMFIVSSVTMQRERANGTLERLWTTRLHRGDFIGGYALAFGLLAVLQSLILVAVMDLFMNVTSHAEWWILALIAGATGVTGLSLGLLGSAFARSEFQAVQLMPVLIIPQILLCGLLVPRAQLPELLRWLSDAMPLSYAVEAATEAARSGFSRDVAQNTAICIGFALVFLALAAVTMPRRTR
ncbi:ABC transporter permease [Corynebacterium comes]|uniref:Transport permease protein n=1 Tax=Corynebacterium comes TaxID=2675218 RepID=A0A6B8W0C0_9CORY|nr:ABC transporter permease [Corynebacterium comes]QGU04386.1 ABC-2 type transporter [Corynebacterium comes]